MLYYPASRGGGRWTGFVHIYVCLDILCLFPDILVDCLFLDFPPPKIFKNKEGGFLIYCGALLLGLPPATGAQIRG